MPAPSTLPLSVSHHRPAQRTKAQNKAVAGLPDTQSEAHLAEMAEACRKLAELTDDEIAMADAFAKAMGQIDEWR